MRFYLTGEGPSDLCDRVSGVPGLLKDALVQLSAKDVDPSSVEYVGVSRITLKTYSGRGIRPSRQMLLRGNRRTEGKLADVVRVAESFGRFTAAQDDDECGAVLFADCDFTNSQVNNPDRYHLQMIEAVETGFHAADGFRWGVAMIPKMRSESWLLCKYQAVPYAPGVRFEALPANDQAPNCAKNELSSFLGVPVDEMYARVIYSDAIDWTRIDCPSYKFFERRFRYVLCCLAHVSPDCTEPETLVTKGARP